MLVLREDVLLRCGVSSEDGILIALSGGADSVALLLEMKRLQSAGKIGPIAAAHLNHGIRGAEADRDAAFCRALCERLAVPYAEGFADVPALASEKGVSLETAARTARYAFLNAEKARADCGFWRRRTIGTIRPKRCCCICCAAAERTALPECGSAAGI